MGANPVELIGDIANMANVAKADFAFWARLRLAGGVSSSCSALKCAFYLVENRARTWYHHPNSPHWAL